MWINPPPEATRNPAPSTGGRHADTAATPSRRAEEVDRPPSSGNGPHLDSGGSSLDRSFGHDVPFVLVPAASADPLAGLGLGRGLFHQGYDLVPGGGGTQVELELGVAEAEEVGMALALYLVRRDTSSAGRSTRTS